MEHIKKMKISPVVCQAIKTAVETNTKHGAQKKIAEAFGISESTLMIIKRCGYDFNKYLTVASPTYKLFGDESLPEVVKAKRSQEDTRKMLHAVVIYLAGMASTMLIVSLLGGVAR